MSALRGHVDDYLSLRRALGFKLVFEGHVLPQLAAFVETAGSATVTTELAIAWAGLPGDGVLPISRAHRLGAARGFARYLRSIDGIAEIPPTGVWSTTTPRPEPHIWSEPEIRLLLDATDRLAPHQAVTLRTLFGLLAATGIRIGEALALNQGDLANGTLTITNAKTGRTRLVPIHPSTAAAIAVYLRRHGARANGRAAHPLFTTPAGTRLSYSSVHNSFNALTSHVGLRTPTHRPRIHGLRHTFAVRTLIDWHRDGIDIHARLPVLSTYLGHLNPSGTYWYLTAVPELMELAADRLTTRGGRL